MNVKNLEEAAQVFYELDQKATQRNVRARNQIDFIRVTKKHEKYFGIAAFAIAELYKLGEEKLKELGQEKKNSSVNNCWGFIIFCFICSRTILL